MIDVGDWLRRRKSGPKLRPPEGEGVAQVTTVRGSRVHSKVRGFSRGVGIAVAGLGGVVLAGWALDVPVLKSISPGLLTMKPNTAIGFVLAGISLWLRDRRGERATPSRVIGRACAGVTVLIGALTLAEHLGKWDLGIDCLMFQDAGAIGTSPPGRMCPASSLVLVLLGAALLLLDGKRRVPSQVLALTAGLIAGVALVGYVFGAPSLYSFAPYHVVALHTAGGGLLLSMGVLGAQPERGLLLHLTGDAAGSKLARRLLPAAILVPLLLGRLALSGERWGHFGTAMTTAVSAVLSILVLTALIWWNAGNGCRAEEARRSSDERLRMATEAARVGLWFWHAPTDRVEWTTTCRELVGGAPDRPISLRALGDAVHPEDRGRVRRAVLDALADEAEHAVEYRVVQPDGAVRWLAVQGRAFREAGRPHSMMGVAADITERKQVEHVREGLLDSERAARSALERLARMKDEFLGTLSHELRTPLTAILGWTQIARTTPEGRTVSECLAIIERNARLQERLVDDLLDMNRIASGKLQLETRPVDLSTVVGAAVDTLMPTADAKGIRCTRKAELPPGRATVVGDPDRLQQVVRNLLGNAIKFTPKGGEIHVAVTRSDGFLEARVSDTGPGIPADFVPCVFERFRQADASTTRRHGGLGLGLAIVKELVELHGGTVAAESEGVGRGAAFTVRLPAADAQQAPSDDHDGRAPSEGAAQKGPRTALPQGDRERLRDVKVLVVDDDPETCELVERVLGEHAARVTTALTPRQALDAFQRDVPDVLVSDVGMPDVDGFELMRRIRSFEEGTAGRVPAVALTAFVRPEDQARALSAGYQVFLCKPIECSKLVSAVAQLVSGGHERGTGASGQARRASREAGGAGLVAGRRRLRS